MRGEEESNYSTSARAKVCGTRTRQNKIGKERRNDEQEKQKETEKGVLFFFFF